MNGAAGRKKTKVLVNPLRDLNLSKIMPSTLNCVILVSLLCCSISLYQYLWCCLQFLNMNSCLKGVYPTNLLLNVLRMTGLSLGTSCRITQCFSKITSFFHGKLWQTQAPDQTTCNRQTESTEGFSGQENKTPSIPFINSIIT